MNNQQMENTLNFEQTLMYGQYKKDLAKFARQLSSRRARSPVSSVVLSSHVLPLKKSNKFFRFINGFIKFLWKYTIGIIGEDWIYLALLGITMAIISFIVDFFIIQCHQTRLLLYEKIFTYNLFTQYIGWIILPVILLIFATGLVNIISPQAIGSGIPEMKTILRGVILYEYLSFRTLLAKLIGLCCSLGSGLPLGKEGPFVHTGSMVSTLLSKLFLSFKSHPNNNKIGKNINHNYNYNYDLYKTEMLAAACAVGVATTFYSPIGGVLFSVEVTTDFFAIRNYWRGFFSACCAATVWRLFSVWFRNEVSLTSLFKTNFRTDYPFDPQELLVFSFIGLICGLGGAAYVRCHRHVVHYIRNQRTLNTFLKKNRFIYPTLITFILMSVSFPPFMGQFMASTLSNPQTFKELFSNITWNKHHYVENNNKQLLNDSQYLTMVKHWQTNYTNIYINLIITIINTFWMSILAATIPVPSGLFVPIFKIGAAFGRLVGEIMAAYFPDGIAFSGYTIPIVSGGYSVVGAAAFTGAVTHTISITVIIFEMTGQMSHMIPVILSVLISNAISQKLELSIYDSVIQIKKLPFLPAIKMIKNNIAHNIYIDNIIKNNIIYVCHKNFTYRQLLHLLNDNPTVEIFPFVNNSEQMILLGTIQREELQRQLFQLLCHEKRLKIYKKLTDQDLNEDNGDDDSIKFISDNEDDDDSGQNAYDNNDKDDGQNVGDDQDDGDEGDGDQDADDQDDDGQGENGQDVQDENEKTIPSTMKILNNMKKNRFDVSLVKNNDNDVDVDVEKQIEQKSKPKKSILKQTFTIITTYSPHSTINNSSTINHLSINKDNSRLRQVFEDIFQKSLHLKDAYPNLKQISDTDGNNNNNKLMKNERRVKLPRERIIDLSVDEQHQWEQEQLNTLINFNDCYIDPAPFQLVEHTTLYKVHLLFSMLSLQRAYVTSFGRLIGIIDLVDLKNAIDKLNQGLLQPQQDYNDHHYIHNNIQ